MIRQVLSVLVLASISLLACSNHQKERTLTEKATQTFHQAEQLHTTPSCAKQQEAVRLLAVLDTEIETASDERPFSSQELDQLHQQATDIYNAYIRESYFNQCCWAIELIVQCADENTHILTPQNKQNLVQIKHFYTNKCCANHGQQTAMLF